LAQLKSAPNHYLLLNGQFTLLMAPKQE